MYFISFGSYIVYVQYIHAYVCVTQYVLRSFLYEPSFNSNVCMAVCAYVLALVVNSVTFLPISLALIIFHAKHHDVCASSSSSSYAFMAI